MLKQITAAVFLLAFFAGSFSKSLIVADYFVNTSSYAKDCINKARPKMHCNGKCQMMMKLKAEEKKESENTEKKINLQNEVISSKSFFTSPISFKEQVLYSPTAPVFNDNNTVSMPRAFFHPPSC
jgi:hypothetical protein